MKKVWLRGVACLCVLLSCTRVESDEAENGKFVLGGMYWSYNKLICSGQERDWVVGIKYSCILWSKMKRD